jgi:hypothetical protein
MADRTAIANTATITTQIKNPIIIKPLFFVPSW